MANATPSPVTTQIRKIIFENFNDVDLRFNNDQIFEILQQNESIDTSWTIDNAVSYTHLTLPTILLV